jgi:thiol-disulfide isomerase/thioredoxin
MREPRTRRELLVLAGLGSVALAGCVGGDSGSSDDGGDGTNENGDGSESGDEMDDGGDGTGESGDGGASGDEMDDGGDGTSENGASGESGDGSDGTNAADGWQAIDLEDATTGEQFSIAGIDRPVVLHTFATWCPTCRAQQGEIDTYVQRAGDSVAAVDLTIDQNDDPAALRQHAESNGFGWRFGVSPGEMTRELVDEFGQSVAVAPRSPVIVVCPDGRTNTLGKGASADEIEAAVESNCG